MSGRRVLIVDDDAVFGATLLRSFERRGYAARHAASVAAMEAILTEYAPTDAVVDLRLDDASGLICVARLAADVPDIRIVVLTGFASLATAVEAVKLGAINYLAKPANTDDIIAALDAPRDGDAAVPAAERASTLRTVEWEHIHRTLAEADFNISEAARRLGMHRRTLARKLDKRHL